jgi:hypothetical protein
MLNSLGFSHSRLAPATMKPQLINARPIYLALRCSIRSCIKWFVASRPSHGLTTPVDRFRDATR